MLAGMVFALPMFTIRPITGPEAGVSLRTKDFTGSSGIPSIFQMCCGASVGR